MERGVEPFRQGTISTRTCEYGWAVETRKDRSDMVETAIRLKGGCQSRD